MRLLQSHYTECFAYSIVQFPCLKKWQHEIWNVCAYLCACKWWPLCDSGNVNSRITGTDVSSAQRVPLIHVSWCQTPSSAETLLQENAWANATFSRCRHKLGKDMSWMRLQSFEIWSSFRLQYFSSPPTLINIQPQLCLSWLGIKGASPNGSAVHRQGRDEVHHFVNNCVCK